MDDVGFLDLDINLFQKFLELRTPRKTNLAPENRPLEKEGPTGNHQC